MANRLSEYHGSWMLLDTLNLLGFLPNKSKSPSRGIEMEIDRKFKKSQHAAQLGAKIVLRHLESVVCLPCKEMWDILLGMVISHKWIWIWIIIDSAQTISLWYRVLQDHFPRDQMPNGSHMGTKITTGRVSWSKFSFWDPAIPDISGYPSDIPCSSLFILVPTSSRQLLPHLLELCHLGLAKYPWNRVLRKPLTSSFRAFSNLS